MMNISDLFELGNKIGDNFIPLVLLSVSSRTMMGILVFDKGSTFFMSILDEV